MRPNPNAFLWFRTPDPELDRYVTHARAYQRAYYAAHQEKIRAYYAAYREEKRAHNRAYRVAHKKELRAYQHVYRMAHKEEIRARNRAYHAAHQEERRAYNRAYRAAHKKTAPILFQSEGWIALEKDKPRIPLMAQMGVAFA